MDDTTIDPSPTDDARAVNPADQVFGQARREIRAAHEHINMGRVGRISSVMSSARVHARAKS
jgi:hypothetical protein